MFDGTHKNEKKVNTIEKSMKRSQFFWEINEILRIEVIWTSIIFINGEFGIYLWNIWVMQEWEKINGKKINQRI